MFNTFTFSLYLLLSLLLATATCLPTIGVTYSTTAQSPTPPPQDRITTAQSPTPPPQDRITTAMKNLTLTSLRDLGMYRLRPEISLGMELFQERQFNFRDNFTTGVRYRNFFDGYETIPVIYTETGWPSARNDLDANSGYAEIYLRGLVKHLKSGAGTPLLKDAVKSESINNLLPTITIHVSLRDLGIRKISVSSFLINLYPYNMYRLRPEISLEIELFQEHPFNFRDDFTTGVRYRYLFDIMVDDVVSSMAFVGYETIPVIVTETGWPSAGNDLDANSGYAEFYLRGLVKHLKSGAGTPLLKDGVKAVYLYELFDKDGTGSTKYRIIFSEASRSCLMNWINVALILALTMVVQVRCIGFT
ncbi:hypothetical protein P8452_64136 [Trifolium repens]|nr:hypothetical protein P8452_64136 [Trifolium repens]